MIVTASVPFLELAKKPENNEQFSRAEEIYIIQTPLLPYVKHDATGATL